MSDRIESNHPSIETIRGTLVRYGGTRTLALSIPIDEEAIDQDDLPSETVLRVHFEGTTFFTTLESASGERRLRGAYESPRLARNPGDGTNRFHEWIDGLDREAGASILVDVIEPGYAFGLRVPGETVVYPAFEPPDSSLHDIASDLSQG